MPATGFRGPRQLLAAFIWSMKGLRAAYRCEASFRLEAGMVVILIPLGLWLGHGAVEKLLLAGIPLVLLSVELLNSAIEAVVDKVSPEFHELAGRAKDMGSAAVLMLLLLIALSWLLLIILPLFS